MKSVIITAPDTIEVREVDTPEAGPGDVLVRIRACGVCGTDVFYHHLGGLPHVAGRMTIGHEPAGEVVGVGEKVADAAVGDHVVINPMAAADGIIGNGGAQGALSEYLLLREAVAGTHFRVIPSEIPWEVAALNEPMAVALHGVNRSGAGEGSNVVVFGAGPIGLGAAIAFKAKGAAHVVVVDLVRNRLEKALRVGADAVIDSSSEDVVERLRELHGTVPGQFGLDDRPGTDVYLDATGVKPVIDTIMRAVKNRAVVTVVGVHKQPVELDFQTLLAAEPDIRLAMGYPTEIFEVTDALIAHWDKYQHIVSDVIPFSDVQQALRLAGTPGATDKVVVTFA